MNKIIVGLKLKMIKKIRDWVRQPATKIIKKTYGNGVEVYSVFIRFHRFQKWVKVIGVYNHQKMEWLTLEEAQKIAAERLKEELDSRVVSVEEVS